MRMNRRLVPAMLVAVAVLAGCATEPLTPPPSEPIRPAELAVVNPVTPYFIPTAALAPTDTGIIALADAVAGADLISFMGYGAYSEEDARLKAVLTLALTERHDLGVVILDTPCAGASILDTYISGAQTGDLAVDIVRYAEIVPTLKSAALADLLTQLRGWNAVNINAPVRISGKGCTTARDASPDRPAIFWGFTEMPASMGEKDMAAAARGGPAAEDHVWIVQEFGDTYGVAGEGDGWIDMRTLPDDQRLVEWRETQRETSPWIDAGHAWAADIIFVHRTRTPAPGL